MMMMIGISWQCQPGSSSVEGADASDKCTCGVGKARSSDGTCVEYWVSGVQYNLTESTLKGWVMVKEVPYNSPMTLIQALEASGVACGRCVKLWS